MAFKLRKSAYEEDDFDYEEETSNSSLPFEFTMKLTGVTFEGRQTAVSQLSPGQSLEVKAVNNNPYDANCIELFDSYGRSVGFVSRDRNQEFRSDMKKGYVFTANVDQVTGGGYSYSYGVVVRFRKTLRRKNMADLQALFDKCRTAYKLGGYLDVSLVGNWLSEQHLDNEKKERFNSELLCKNFDIILQFSLLQIAVADNELDSKELVFIRDLTIKGDLIEYLNSLVESKISWETVYNADVFELKGLLKDIEPLMESLSNDLATAFAICDVSTIYNCVLNFKKSIMTIITGLGKMDGDFSYLEQHADCLIIRVISEMENRKQKLKREFPEDFN